MYLTKINRNGQISLPAALRKQLSLKVGDWVQIEQDEAGQVLLLPVEVRRKQKEPDWARYEREGVDVSLIVSNRRVSPTDRLRNNKNMLSFMEEIQKNRANSL